MDPVGIVYSTPQGDYLYVSKFSNGVLWIGQGDSSQDAVSERSVKLDLETAKALANILTAEAYTD